MTNIYKYIINNLNLLISFLKSDENVPNDKVFEYLFEYFRYVTKEYSNKLKNCLCTFSNTLNNYSI